MIKALTKEIINYTVALPKFMYGFWKVSRLREPRITIFGGRMATLESEYYKTAFDCGKLLAQKDFSIISGGGPGIMEAILCGYMHQKENDANILGVGIAGVDEDFKPHCTYNIVFLPNFALRKKLLIDYAQGFIVFPGGIGTLDELADLMNLIKTKKRKQVPIVLVGSRYWQLLKEWLDYAMEESFIMRDYTNLIKVTDSIEETVSLLVKKH